MPNSEEKTETKPAGIEEKKQEDPKIKKEKEKMAAMVKELEKAIFSIKFYPVAVNEEDKNAAIEKLVKIYNKENETTKQLMLFMLHETLADSGELKAMHNSEYIRAKKPSLEPAQVRMNVYRAMFNYNTSVEGLIEIIQLLGRFKGSDDAAKLLTYHFSHLCFYENEATHMLRGAILETLGETDSPYALKALLEYAKNTDNERTFRRIVSALTKWQKKLDSVKTNKKDKEQIQIRLKEVITKEFSESHYG